MAAAWFALLSVSFLLRKSHVAQQSQSAPLINKTVLMSDISVIGQETREIDLVGIFKLIGSTIP